MTRLISLAGLSCLVCAGCGTVFDGGNVDIIVSDVNDIPLEPGTNGAYTVGEGDLLRFAARGVTWPFGMVDYSWLVSSGANVVAGIGPNFSLTFSVPGQFTVSVRAVAGDLGGEGMIQWGGGLYGPWALFANLPTWPGAQIFSDQADVLVVVHDRAELVTVGNSAGNPIPVEVVDGQPPPVQPPPPAGEVLPLVVTAEIISPADGSDFPVPSLVTFQANVQVSGGQPPYDIDVKWKLGNLVDKKVPGELGSNNKCEIVFIVPLIDCGVPLFCGNSVQAIVTDSAGTTVESAVDTIIIVIN